MSDGTVGVRQAQNPDRLVDNEVTINEHGETVYRQKVSVASNIRSMPVIAYYASKAGGRVAFNITSNIVTLSGAGEQPLAALINPADSEYDIYLWMGEFGSSINTTFRRYRNRIITPTGTPNVPNNMGGGTATSPLRIYSGGDNPQYEATGGNIAKTAHISAYDQYKTALEGMVVLRPSNSMCWTISNASAVGNAFTASVYFEYWQLPVEV